MTPREADISNITAEIIFILKTNRRKPKGRAGKGWLWQVGHSVGWGMPENCSHCCHGSYSTPVAFFFFSGMKGLEEEVTTSTCLFAL